MDELLGAADAVSLHAPLTAETSKLLGAAAFERMRRGAFLVNTSRGGLVDQDALADAVGFTGSTGGGRALYDLAVGRENPIPFYGELGSINPVVVTEAAVAARGREVAEGLAGSFRLGTGQFCTKPAWFSCPPIPASTRRSPMPCGRGTRADAHRADAGRLPGRYRRAVGGARRA